MASVAAAQSASVTESTSGLRNGFSLSAGQEFGGDRDVSGTMFGFDWRIGYRVSEGADPECARGIETSG